MNVKLSERIERVFSTRLKLAQVRLADEVIQLDDDEEDALWFSGRDWHEITWQNWQEHSDAIFFFDPEPFVYYLPSILLLSAQNPNESLNAGDSLIGELDRTPDPKGMVRSQPQFCQTQRDYQRSHNATGVLPISQFRFAASRRSYARDSHPRQFANRIFHLPDFYRCLFRA
jgi:hypothetical protein